jgi:hypothetical protein
MAFVRIRHVQAKAATMKIEDYTVFATALCCKSCDPNRGSAHVLGAAVADISAYATIGTGRLPAHFLEAHTRAHLAPYRKFHQAIEAPCTDTGHRLISQDWLLHIPDSDVDAIRTALFRHPGFAGDAQANSAESPFCQPMHIINKFGRDDMTENALV